MRVVFLGTPEFAVPPLRALHGAGHEIAGVFTQPDRPAGRGHKLAAPPVKIAATELGLPVFQFERIRKQEGIDALRAAKPDILVTAAFGQLLSKVNLGIPKLGTVNVHASLLPGYRGPAPINWCIMNGERESGVTTMYTDIGVDTGDIIDCVRTPIGDRETAGELTARLSLLGAELIVKTLDDIQKGKTHRQPQDHERASHHPMLSREMGEIRWADAARRIDCQTRGMDPWPGAFSSLGEEIIKIWKVRVAEGDGAPGEILRADAKQGLFTACGDGALEILELQPPGKGRMAAKDYLRGHPLQTGMRWGSTR